MSALLKKEFRLLLPAWIAAMLLPIASFPIGQLINLNVDETNDLMVACAALGCLVLGLAGFGREFESRTFPLLLVQPRERKQFWRTKVFALLVALLPLGLWMLTFDLSHVPSRQQWAGAGLWLIISTAAISGALWTTLAFRQIFASFWIAILLPIAIAASTQTLLEDRMPGDLVDAITLGLLLVYSIGGYFLARWLFLKAQDTQWTGGNLSLSNVAKWLRWKSTAVEPTKTHPLRALFGKEFDLHESSLLVAALLLVLQVATLMLSRLAKNPDVSVLGSLPDMMCMLWLLMPALIGCTAVAEERKLGILEAQLCLPVPRTWQYLAKVCVTLAYGVALGAIVPILSFNLTRNRVAGLPEFAWMWTFACFGITTICLYASSLTRQMLQALGAAVVFVALWAVLLNWLFAADTPEGYFALFGWRLWRGVSFFIIGAFVMLLFALGHTLPKRPRFWVGLAGVILFALYTGKLLMFLESVLSENQHKLLGLNTVQIVAMACMLCPALLLLALAGKNFKHVQTSNSLWRRNAATWAGCLLITIVTTALVYNRFWEFGKQFEPPVGLSRLSGQVLPAITSSLDESPTFVLLPDGRLCWFKGLERFFPIFSKTTADQTTSSEPRFRAIKTPRVNFAADSNWVAIAKSQSELVGIKSDGSLWSASLLKGLSREANHPLRFERIGNPYDWIAVAAGQSHILALKHDGTIWGWGSLFRNELGESPNPFTDGPVRIGHDSDWANVFAGSHWSFGIKRDGSIWQWWGETGQLRSDQKTAEISPAKVNLGVKGVRDIITSGFANGDFELILDETGNLWGYGQHIPAYLLGPNARQIGHKQDATWDLPGPSWTAVAAVARRGIAGIRVDGSLWELDIFDYWNEPILPYKQVGQRTDWIAVAIERDSIVALAKDGALCRFGETLRPDPYRHLLAPLRRVTWSVSVLDAANDSLKQQPR